MTESWCGETAWQARGRESWSEQGSGPSRGSRTCDPPASNPGTAAPPGRRIYIHERSLDRLARRDREAARLVYETLARVSVLKIFHHKVQDGLLFRQISAAAAQRLSEILEPKGSEAVTRCLRALGSRRAPRTEALPLLKDGEEVVASCYFDQHYTFATDGKTAAQMYSDAKPMTEVRRLLERGEGYQDLFLVNGARSESLELLDRKNGARKALTKPEAAMLRMETLGAIRRDLTETVERVPLTGQEQAFAIDWLQKALGDAFSQGVLKTL